MITITNATEGPALIKRWSAMEISIARARGMMKITVVS